MPAIICRFANGNQPAVFIADTLKGDTIQQWDGNKGTKAVPVSYYQTTEPASEADAETMRQSYVKATGQASEAVTVRQRLPRVFRERPTLLAAGNNPAAATVAQAGGKKSRSEAAREQVARDIANANAAGSGPAPEMVTVTLNVPAPHAETLRMLEDPRSAALVLKLADILRTSL